MHGNLSKETYAVKYLSRWIRYSIDLIEFLLPYSNVQFVNLFQKIFDVHWTWNNGRNKNKFWPPRQRLPFLFLSNLSKTFSKPFLLALSSPSLFICMKAIVVQMCRYGQHLLGVPPKPQLKAAVDIGREKLATRKPLVRGVEGRKRRFYS